MCLQPAPGVTTLQVAFYASHLFIHEVKRTIGAIKSLIIYN